MKEKIIQLFNEIFPFPKCELEYENVYQLLIAVILSAQCTDKRVNIVTKELFKKLKEPKDGIKIPTDELEKDIHSCGFYHAKAKAIKEASKDIIERFNGNVPQNIEDLTSLRGVGRKTANVMISEGFKGDAFAVDTHVLRVSNRLGIINTQFPDKAEQELKKYFDKKDWSRLHYQFVLFGRYNCIARKPKCENCKFMSNCKYYNENK